MRRVRAYYCFNSEASYENPTSLENLSAIGIESEEEYLF